MTPNYLIKILEKKYSIVKFIDLGELTVSPGAAHQFFKSVFKDEFRVNERIVIYSSHCPTNQLIEHLHNAAKFYNIDVCFVLLCTPIVIRNVANNIENYFQSIAITLTPTKKLLDNFYLPDTICAIPWSNMEIKQDGSITPCCMSTLVSGQIDYNTIEESFYNEKTQSLRNELLSGNKPECCNNCWSREEQGLTSIRMHNYKRLAEVFLTETFNQPKIKHLDIKFQNTCNFKCLICDPVSSSLHAQERFKYLNIPIKSQSTWSESANFLNQVKQLLPSLTNIDMYGGEPFLIKTFANVLKSAVEQGFAKNIRLHYNSNGSIWPDKLIEYWPHFREVDIHFSIDAVGDRFSYQRGGNWSDVEQNILQIKNLNLKNLKISIMPSVSILSVYYLDEVISWGQKHNFQLFASHVFSPDSFSLSELTQKAKDIINSKFKTSAWHEMQKILDSINSMPASDGKKFCEQIRWYDTVRNTHFADAHAEMAKAMGYFK